MSWFWLTYTQTTMSSSPPPYSAEPTRKRFPIGPHNPEALVDNSQLEAHLKLLGAFDKLREHVETQDGLAKEDKNGAWALFLARAVYRFERWAEKVMVKLGQYEERTCPPLDVAIVSLDYYHYY